MIKYEDPQNKADNYQTISVITSRDCTLRCEYCYLSKHADNEYDMDSIIDSVDKLLYYYHNAESSSTQVEKGIILDFYPEPWVNVERTNTLVTRCLKLLKKYPSFYDKYIISMGTNGLLLDKPIPIVEQMLDRISVAVTVDGIKEQHDKYRVTSSGQGSWDKVVSNVRAYQDKYKIYNTKVTIGPDSIKYMLESLKFLWFDLNMDSVFMNVVFEEIWGNEEEKKNCLVEYEKQLVNIKNFIIENRLWEKNKYTSVLGNKNIPQMPEVDGLTLGTTFKNKPYCGASVMRSVDVDGSIYPCFRLSPYALNQPSPFEVNKNNFTEGPMRALNGLNSYDAAPFKCLSCELLSVCHMCIGGAYEETKSIYYRTTHHCEFTKLENKYSLELRNEINKA